MSVRASTTTAAEPTVTAASTQNTAASAVTASGSGRLRRRADGRGRGGGGLLLRVLGEEHGVLLREAIEVLGEVGGGELVLGGHVDAVGGARVGAEVAVAAERHVDVEDRHVQLDGLAVRGPDGRSVRRPLLRLERDAVHRAGAHALAAADAVLELH